MNREQIDRLIKRKLGEENSRLASHVPLYIIEDALSLLRPDECVKALEQHRLSAIVQAYEDGQRVYAAMENRHENEPKDPVLRAAYCAGYESAM